MQEVFLVEISGCFRIFLEGPHALVITSMIWGTQNGPLDSIWGGREATKKTNTKSDYESNDKFKAVKLLTHGDKLQVSAHNPSQESAEEELKYSGFKTDEVPFDITFNVNYLRDVLSTIEDDEITIIRSGKGSLIKSGDPNQIIVLMPLLL